MEYLITFNNCFSIARIEPILVKLKDRVDTLNYITPQVVSLTVSAKI